MSRHFTNKETPTHHTPIDTGLPQMRIDIIWAAPLLLLMAGVLIHNIENIGSCLTWAFKMLPGG